MKGSTKSFSPDTFSDTDFQTTQSCKRRPQSFRSSLAASVPKKGTAVNLTQYYHIEIAIFLQLQLSFNRRSVTSEMKLSDS